ncbi:AzlD domain-containing protein [Pollutimonas harenae]|uniref:AzlD domain-containing protein n=1 Tax=Pollutimonas harenae TaxID=657015 RepID=A0A853GX80_9BURK|nr:AzlD domain-containing protein [Pollutimonas harenae]NYT85356.1 AzlD domain-containing protein [Pollutimonas harenae]TEA70458.1 AzlD domain-containing protein [Pollutimonas harenae]
MTGNLEYDLYILGGIVLLTLCSFLTRSGYFLFGEHIPLTDSVRSALRYAPTAALVGILVPELLPWTEAGPVADIRILAVIAAVLVFWRTRSTVMVIVGGMVAYWILKAVQNVYF